MKPVHNRKSDDDDPLLNKSIFEGDDDMSLSGDEDLRFARIEDDRFESLRRDSSRRANLGATLAGLFEITALQENLVKDALRSATGNPLESPHVRHATDTYIQLTKQTTSLADLDLRLDKMEHEAMSRQAQRRMRFD